MRDESSKNPIASDTDDAGALAELQPRPVSDRESQAVVGGAISGDKADMKTGVANITKKAI